MTVIQKRQFNFGDFIKFLACFVMSGNQVLSKFAWIRLI